ncbi:hypothetical protein Gotri_023834 [Gossypium trilobum]|nr:hypothetical protein [Gossypium trilobum]
MWPCEYGPRKDNKRKRQPIRRGTCQNYGISLALV